MRLNSSSFRGGLVAFIAVVEKPLKTKHLSNFFVVKHSNFITNLTKITLRIVKSKIILDYFISNIANNLPGKVCSNKLQTCVLIFCSTFFWTSDRVRSRVDTGSEDTIGASLHCYYKFTFLAFDYSKTYSIRYNLDGKSSNKEMSCMSELILQIKNPYITQ